MQKRPKNVTERNSLSISQTDSEYRTYRLCSFIISLFDILVVWVCIIVRAFRSIKVCTNTYSLSTRAQ